MKQKAAATDGGFTVLIFYQFPHRLNVFVWRFCKEKRSAFKKLKSDVNSQKRCFKKNGENTSVFYE